MGRFLEAWQAHDLDAVMGHLSKDCTFYASTGMNPRGSTHRGPDDVRRAFQSLLDRFPNATWTEVRHSAWEDRGISEWIFAGTSTDGERVTLAGCDLFTFRGDEIVVKDTFCKRTSW